jgi:1,4-alpha-glucan branching enzyme
VVRDLNRLYHSTPALYQREFDWEGFEWIDCHDAQQSVLSYLRKGNDDFAVVILNFTPIPRHNYRIGVPAEGVYEEAFNSDSAYYAGSNVGNGAALLNAEPRPWMGRPYSVPLTVPPLGAIVLRLKPPSEELEADAESAGAGQAVGLTGGGGSAGRAGAAAPLIDALTPEEPRDYPRVEGSGPPAGPGEAR